MARRLLFNAKAQRRRDFSGTQRHRDTEACAGGNVCTGTNRRDGPLCLCVSVFQKKLCASASLRLKLCLKLRLKSSQNAAFAAQKWHFRPSKAPLSHVKTATFRTFSTTRFGSFRDKTDGKRSPEAENRDGKCGFLSPFCRFWYAKRRFWYNEFLRSVRTNTTFFTYISRHPDHSLTPWQKGTSGLPPQKIMFTENNIDRRKKTENFRKQGCAT